MELLNASTLPVDITNWHRSVQNLPHLYTLLRQQFEYFLLVLFLPHFIPNKCFVYVLALKSIGRNVEKQFMDVKNVSASKSSTCFFQQQKSLEQEINSTKRRT